MTTHAHTHDDASLRLRIEQLAFLSMDELWVLWDEHFKKRPQHHHRTWLESQLAYRLQEKVYGGLRESVRRKLEQIGETEQLPRGMQNERDRLLPGTILRRAFGDDVHEVTVVGPRDYSYAGKRYTSLSAISRQITGVNWSGPLFFGLRQTKPSRSTA
jgi:hypothetical protein